MCPQPFWYHSVRHQLNVPFRGDFLNWWGNKNSTDLEVLNMGSQVDCNGCVWLGKMQNLSICALRWQKNFNHIWRGLTVTISKKDTNTLPMVSFYVLSQNTISKNKCYTYKLFIKWHISEQKSKELDFHKILKGLFLISLFTGNLKKVHGKISKLADGSKQVAKC